MISHSVVSFLEGTFTFQPQVSWDPWSAATVPGRREGTQLKVHLRRYESQLATHLRNHSCKMLIWSIHVLSWLPNHDSVVVSYVMLYNTMPFDLGEADGPAPGTSGGLWFSQVISCCISLGVGWTQDKQIQRFDAFGRGSTPENSVVTLQKSSLN